jgi:DNA-binding NtrC family response regulator
MLQAKILLVDNDTDTRNLLAGVLEEAGYNVDPRASGEEALAALEQETYNLLLAEIRMRPTGGLQLLEHVRQAGLPMNVIVMTPFPSDQTREAARQGGAFEYLVKPFSLARFREQVREAIDAGVVHRPSTTIPNA